MNDRIATEESTPAAGGSPVAKKASRSPLQRLLRAAGRRIDFAEDAEALAALGSIREKWNELRDAAAARDIAGVVEFTDALAAEARGGPLGRLLDDVGLSGDAVREALEKITDVFNSIDPKYHLLLQPIASFDENANGKDFGVVHWSLIGAKRGNRARTTRGQFTFELGAKASLVLEAGDGWPDEDPQVPGPLLRIGLAGSLDAGGRAGVPVRAGKVGLGLAVSRDAYADFYFDARSDDGPYASSVARRLPALPSPLSLASVTDAFRRSDLAGIVIETEGETDFSVRLSASEGFALTHELKAGVRLDFAARVRRAGRFYLRLREITDPRDLSSVVELTIERNRGRENEHALGLGVEVDAASLSRRLTAMLERHEGGLKEVLEPYRPYLTPSEYLGNEGSELLQRVVRDAARDPELAAALQELVQRAFGVAGEAEDGGAMEQWLSAEIKDLLDGASGVITGALDDVAAELGQKLEEKHGIAASAADKLRKRLEQLVDGIRANLEQKLSELSQSAEADLDELLARLGARASRLSSAAEKADDVGRRVRELLARHEKTLHALKAAAADAARMKLVARVTAEESVVRERVMEAKLLFRRAGEDAERLFGDVLEGRFDSIMRVIEHGHPDVDVGPDGTMVNLFKATRRRLGCAVVLFGFELGRSTVLDAQSRMEVDGAGNVSVRSEAVWRRRVERPREEREISFVNVYELAAASVTGELSLALALSHSDEVLKRREVEKLIGSFEDAGLLPRGTTARALELFVDWFGQGERKGIVADIDFAMPLDARQAARLMGLTEREGGNLTPAAGRRIFEVALLELVESGAYSMEYVARMAEVIRGRTGADSSQPRMDVLFEYTKRKHRRFRDPRRDHDLERAFALHRLGISFVQLVEVMGDIYEAVPAVDGASGWDESRYDEAQRELSKHLGRWLKVKTRLFWIAPEAHPRVVAFIGAVAALTEIDGADGAVLNLSLTNRSVAEPVTVML